MKKLITIILFLLIYTSANAVNHNIYQFSTTIQQQQFQQLTYELRCLVCQNQSIAESNAPLAADLRREIADKINKGQNSQEILNYLVARYGDYILYNPPLTQSTYILWMGPFALLIIGLLILFITVRRQKSEVRNQE